MNKEENIIYTILTEQGQQTGLSHIQNHQNNQDVAIKRENDRIMIIGLADGQSNKTRSAEGGHIVLNQVAGFIERVGIESIESYRYYDELVYDVMKEIRDSLQKKAEICHIDVGEFSSTMILMAIDKTTGKFVIMHLGDGIVLGVRNQSVVYISMPENGITSQYTWLTTSQGALNHLRIDFGNVADYDRIILASDGAEDICHGKRIQQRARRLLLTGRQRDIIEYMLSSQHEDDATLIVTDINRPPQTA